MIAMFGLDEDQSLRLIYLVLLLALLIGAGFGWRGRSSRYGDRSRLDVRHLGIWLLIGLGLVAAYAYRAPLQRIAAPVLQELSPSRAVEITNPDGSQELSITRGVDGHFHIDGDANGARIRFLIDTGASTTVLTLRDAERSGIDVAALEFNRPVQTANGIAFFARADLGSLEIGPFRLQSLSVGVMPEGSLDTSLLGMNTINRFAGWRVDGNRMVLVP
ncbi:MAG: retropepsin-like aspartic protease family protein [Propylenella sp.]